LEKQKGHILLERRVGIYPEMLELVYRLRNQLRSCLDVQERQYLEARGSAIEKPVAPIEPGVPPLGDELYLLTENLYKYRAFIDEESFQMLHRYKRLLQDAQVLFNRMDRPLSESIRDNNKDLESLIARANKDFITRYEESIENLKMIYHEIDELYPRITTCIKKHIGTFLER
jgi:AAA+ ATPase superfamily predicted ATPase